MAELKSVYLVHGDDDAKIDAWRARLRRRAEEERGPGGLELFDGAVASPEEVAAALATMSFDTGTRYLLVDGAEAWKAPRLGPLESTFAAMPSDTVLVLIVRGKPLKQLVKAVEASGGELRECAAPKPWELPKWVIERGREEGLQLDGEAAKELISTVGPGQQRLVRELEKLALAMHPSTRLAADDVERHAAGDTAPGVYELADALVAGDLRTTLALAEEIVAHDGQPGALLWAIARRLREVQRAAALLESGVSEQEAGEAVSRQPWLAKKVVARAKKADRAALERAIEVLAELEIDLRGGGDAALDERTAFTLALARAAA